jgi:hypothetical protein
MDYSVDLADPLADIRDVVETFRTSGVTPQDWHGKLMAALVALDRLPGEPELGVIPAQLRVLLQYGLDDAPRLVDQVAQTVADILAEMRVPGIPRPEDEEWGFDPTTGA